MALVFSIQERTVRIVRPPALVSGLTKYPMVRVSGPFSLLSQNLRAVLPVVRVSDYWLVAYVSAVCAPSRCMSRPTEPRLVHAKRKTHPWRAVPLFLAKACSASSKNYTQNIYYGLEPRCWWWSGVTSWIMAKSRRRGDRSSVTAEFKWNTERRPFRFSNVLQPLESLVIWRESFIVWLTGWLGLVFGRLRGSSAPCGRCSWLAL